ncbi:SDR family NAD(P)-dependent oxidoreductase [Companilactobacillus sp. DQM5]|uniref:SDR family NAD(P)-dependent oxidoreductase n=1 Tax=Companilactobacillus sp. DQM5 TaxID=3463359 RepID=UPI0040586480
MNDLTNKVVAITGASSGIGKQVAIESVRRGAQVVLMARNVEKLEEVKKKCEEINLNSAEILKLDVGNTDEVDEVIEKIYQKYQTVDYVLNAAGFGDFSSNFVNADFDTIQEMFIVNVLGLMYVSRIFAGKMIEQGYGHILNIGSMAGKLPTAKAAAYAATKAAVIAFSDGLRLELQPLNVYVTTINPGPVNTNFFTAADPSGKYINRLKETPISKIIFLEPDSLAIEIVNSFGKRKREINKPKIMAVASVLTKVAPHIGDYITSHFGDLK